MLRGPRPPHPPTIGDPEASKRRRKRNVKAHARYMTALFRGWDADLLAEHGQSFYSEHAFNAFLQSLIDAACPLPERPRDDDHDHAVVMEKIVNNTALLLRSSKATRETLGRYRFSEARRFGLSATKPSTTSAQAELQDADVEAALNAVAAATGLHQLSKGELFLAEFNDVLERLTRPTTTTTTTETTTAGDAAAAAVGDVIHRENAVSAAVAHCRQLATAIEQRAKQRTGVIPRAGADAAGDADAANPNPFQDGAAPDAAAPPLAEPAGDLPADRAYFIDHEATDAAEHLLPPGLDDGQRAFVLAALAQICPRATAARDGVGGSVRVVPPPGGVDPRLMLLVGGPGCGKTYVCNIIASVIERLAAAPGANGRPKLLRCATTGAAAALVGGRTYHSALRLGPQHANRDNEQAMTTTLAEFVTELRGYDAIMIDECSMLGQRGLAMIEHRLRARDPTLPFGGLVVILSGDFWQLPPVCDCALYDPLPTMQRRRAVKAAPKRAPPPTLRAATFVPTLMNVAQFTRFVLNQQHRVANQNPENYEHIQMLAKLRDNSSVQGALEDLIKNARFLDANRGDPWPEKTTLLVSGNRERAYANRVLAVHDARRRGLPVLAFPLPSQKRSLVDAPEDTFYFVPGAPGVITHNVDVANGITNGTPCTLTRLAFADPSPRHRPAYDEARRRYRDHALPGEIVRFPYAPEYIVVDVQRPGGAVMTEIPLDKSNERDNDGTLHFKVEVGYALTFHKVQGMSLPSVVLDIGRRPRGKGCNLGGDLSLAALYVALSRVTSARGLRFLQPRGVPSWDHIYRLRIAPSLINWLQQGNSSGGGSGAGQEAAATTTTTATAAAAGRRRQRTAPTTPQPPQLSLTSGCRNRRAPAAGATKTTFVAAGGIATAAATTTVAPPLPHQQRLTFLAPY
jgi:hypothetical protein